MKSLRLLVVPPCCLLMLGALCGCFTAELPPMTEEQTALVESIRSPGQANTFARSLQAVGRHERGVNFQIPGSGLTPLMTAVIFQDAGKTGALLAAGAKTSMQDLKGMTALNYAAEQTDAAVLKLLLSAGKEQIDVPDMYGRTPLMNACRLGNSECVKLLLDSGADAALKDKKDRTAPMFAAAARRESLSLILLLKERGLLHDGDVAVSTMILLQAINAKNSETAMYLLKSFPEDIAVSRDHVVPALLAMRHAIHANDEFVVKELIRRNIPLNTEIPISFRVLERIHLENWYKSIAGFGMIDAGQTPLAWAAAEDSIPMMQLLLAAGANPFCKDNLGNFPIDYVRKADAHRFLKKAMDDERKSWTQH